MKTQETKQVQQVSETQQISAPRELSALELSQIGGGVPCSYSGTHDYRLMMSYANFNYCC